MGFYTDPIRLYPSTTGAWENIDLSAYDAAMSSSATMAVVRVINTNLTTAYGFQYKHPSSAEVADATSADAIYQGSQQDFCIPILSKSITLLIDNAAIQVWLVGYFVAGESGSIVQKYNVPRTAATWTAGWQTLTIPESVVPRDARFAIGEVRSSATTTGVNFRPYGSTDNRTVANTHHLSFIIPIDTNGRLDFYCETANTVPSVYITGYLYGGDPNTNGTDISLAAGGAWTLKTSATTGKAVLIQNHSSTQTGKSGWRKYGASSNLQYGINLVSFGICPMDASGQYEIIADGITQDCYVYGVINYSYVIEEDVSVSDTPMAALLPLGVGSGAFFEDTITEATTITDAPIVELDIPMSEGVAVADTVSATTSRGYIDGDKTLPMFTLEATGLYGGTGTLSATLPSLSLETSGLFGAVGSGSAELDIFTLESTGICGESGAFAATLPMFTVVSTGVVATTEVSSALTLPMFTLDAIGDVALDAIREERETVLYAMNTSGFAVSEFRSFGITGICQCNGKLYACGKDGLYEMAGSTDNGDVIRMLVVKSGMHFGSVMRKSITDAYALVRASGGYSARLASEETTGATQTVTGARAGAHGSKTDLPRGVRGRVMELSIFNDSDNDLEISGLNLLAEVSQTRRGRQ